MNLKEENTRQAKCMRANLKFLREERNWSVEKLSELSGIGEKVLLRMENGGRTDTRDLFRLCGIYRIEPREIFSPMKNSPLLRPG